MYNTTYYIPHTGYGIHVYDDSFKFVPAWLYGRIK